MSTSDWMSVPSLIGRNQWQNVDDGGSPDDDSTYIYDGVPSEMFRLTFPDIPWTGSPWGWVITTRLRSEADGGYWLGQAKLRLMQKQSGIWTLIHEGSTANVSRSSYGDETHTIPMSALGDLVLVTGLVKDLGYEVVTPVGTGALVPPGTIELRVTSVRLETADVGEFCPTTSYTRGTTASGLAGRASPMAFASLSTSARSPLIGAAMAEALSASRATTRATPAARGSLDGSAVSVSTTAATPAGLGFVEGWADAMTASRALPAGLSPGQGTSYNGCLTTAEGSLLASVEGHSASRTAGSATAGAAAFLDAFCTISAATRAQLDGLEFADDTFGLGVIRTAAHAELAASAYMAGQSISRAMASGEAAAIGALEGAALVAASASATPVGWTPGDGSSLSASSTSASPVGWSVADARAAAYATASSAIAGIGNMAAAVAQLRVAAACTPAARGFHQPGRASMRVVGYAVAFGTIGLGTSGEYEAAANRIRDRVSDEFADVEGVEVAWDDAPFVGPAGCWVRVAVVFADAAPLQFGGTRTYSLDGDLVVSIMCPVEAGDERSSELADAVNAAFRQVTDGNVGFGIPEHGASSREGSRSRRDVLVPFSAEVPT
jgi:hypothetical protein